jgi:Glycosyltransferase family 87
MSERAWQRMLTVAALALAAVLAFRAPGLGDYPTDAGPALAAIAHGHLSAFFSHQPAMGSLSLFVRAPFAALAVALGNGTLGIYRWGAVPCLLSVAAVAVWLGRIAMRRGSGRLAPVVIVAIALLNPLVNDALYYGHPEELLTASLAVGALLAASEQRTVLTGVLAGLAVASKQWGLLVIPPAILVLERERIRALVLSGVVAGAATLPMVVGSLSGFRHALHYVSHPQPVVTLFTWLYPFSPQGTFRITNIFGDDRMIAGHRLLGAEALISRPLILVLGIAIPLTVWWASGRRLAVKPMLICVTIVLILRCALDPGSAGYYHVPILLTLLALDASAGRRVPIAGLVCWAISYVVVGRFTSYLSVGATNAAYIAATTAACALLVRELRLSIGSRADADAALVQAARA